MWPIAKWALAGMLVIAASSFLRKDFSSDPKIQWRIGEWGECSQCQGQKSRKVVCFDSATEKNVQDDLCLTTKPKNLTNCTMRECPEWIFGDWGKCNVYCKRARLVACRDGIGLIRDDCAAATKPHEIESCCEFVWVVSAVRKDRWKKCKRGSGYFRKSECRRLTSSGNETIVNSRLCARLKDPQPELFCI